MASVAPFSRRQWASQSLRVTAKELSIVNARGKNNAIAERFSKYQMAAEEGNADKKKMVAEPVSPTLRSGNLSVLKKRWEQQQQQPSSSHKTLTQENAPSRPNNPETHPPGHQPTSRELTEPRSDVLKSSSLSQGEDSDPETHSPISQHQAAQPEDLSDMEASRDSQGLQRAAAAAAAAEVPECEKPSVPLNSLKMMFEKGENLSDQVSREQTMDQIMGDGSLADSTPLRDRMALYQAAISKQDVNTDQLDSFCGKQKENVPPFNLDMSPESEPNGRKGFPAESNGSAPGTPASNQKDSSQPRTPRNFQLPIRETCVSCLKTVYPLERLVANQSIYHSSCFRCFHCNSKLSLVNYASLHNSVYCKPHFNQLFKAKGNYDEGFGHRPHKELWETKGESCETSPQSNDQTRPTVQSSSSASDLDSPSVEDSPLAKVNVLTATMEALGQGTPEKSDRPAEARRLKISWPPRTESEDGGCGAATVADGGSAGKLIKAKWPPEEELHASANEHAEEISCLRRSSSLKERSMPFTLAKQSEESPAPEAGRQSPPPPEEEQLLSPEPSNMELQHGGCIQLSQSLTEDSCVDIHSSSGEEEEDKEEEEEEQQQEEEEVEEEDMKSEDNHVTQEEDEEALGGQPEQQEEEEEEEQMEEEQIEEEDGGVLDEMSAEPTAVPPPEAEVEVSRSPQDVGFWDSEEVDDKEEEPEQQQQQEEEEALTVEEMIKRNRYYEDEEEEEEDV
ncbi:LIM domain and actin-binding protein 1a isoform X2 [Cynoglossus semilaevis]|uniref:LIM domain and actin-binding protein 1a isoform X2 n=1 Tax=Cynoglossus semilaevis TaxID=244447 RepID=UPI000D629908|nr:LIM domain and actin-binding protein 1-like isoform X2 [Cynoglossus semilaevis]